MKILLILLLLTTFSCTSNKVSNNHGFISLQDKFEKISINKTNKNDILKIIGPPSSISNFDKNKWFYIQRNKTNQSIFKLGIKKIDKNNVLVVKFNNKGILSEKNILNIDNMNDIKVVKEITEKDFKKNDTMYKIFSSLREKINAPSKKRSSKKN
ncbi:MAG: outer membrane protein assembly factor BamE [Candidatus Pelagibacter sp.]|tara:strand:+ start:264 stop:728 length:465 start_codon:yes stop_codon:yes gene_type:complete